MPKTMTPVTIKNFDQPDEVREFPKGKVELVQVNGRAIGKGTFEPGWRWSEHVKPLAKTQLCEAPHFQYILAGEMKVQLADGSEFTMRQGDVVDLGSGHDAWVEGEDDCVVVDFQGMVDYAKKRR